MPTITFGTTVPGPDNELLEITDFLGNGAFGEVYRASGKSSGKIFAVKLLPLGMLSPNDSKVALSNEMRAAQQVKHPNVVQILYFNDTASWPVGPYVVMEYVGDGNLAKLLKMQEQSKSQLPLNRAIELMIGIAQGGRAINERLIHRDIKPDNILMDGNRPKIGDFGISKFVDESTRQQTFKGGQHPAYMAPEGWQNQANTYKLDVYSVGLVFYQILTTKHPLFDKVVDPSNFIDWQKAHLYEHCPDVRTWRSETSTAFAQLLSRMVAKRPSDRPVWDEILKILSTGEINTPSPHPSVKFAIESAIANKQKLEQEALKAMQQESERENETQLYGYSCDTLIKKLQLVVEQFNTEFQHGQIKRDSSRGFFTFQIPYGHNITVSFFQPYRSGLKLRGGELIGGGWIGISDGRSANLVLLKQGVDDLYGCWVICEIGIMALADPQKLIGRFGIDESTVVPFGFKDAYFYDQIRYAAGGMHVFTYNFIDDPIDFFAQLLAEACK